MKKFTYNKLIRDKIVENMEELGHTVTCKILDDKEYETELNKKLLEEANEFLEMHDPEELADLMEVIYAIAEFKKIDLKQVEEFRLKKLNCKGGFNKKVYLKDVIEN